MYEKELKNLGLADKETKVYLAALELGPQTVQIIAKEAGVNRATAYVQIDLLKAKGLMSEFEKGKKTFYVAESPDRLQSMLKTIESDLSYKRGELSRILPGLLDMFAGMGERPRVRFFEGPEGIKQIREDFGKIKDKHIYSFVNLDNIYEYTPGHEEDYVKQRIQSKVYNHLIYTRKEGAIPNFTNSKLYREAKYLPPKDFPLSADITVYDNKVVMEAYKGKIIGVIIESSEIAGAVKAIFQALWKKA
jgi:sugar-specific transcriptional regulator TrmB